MKSYIVGAGMMFILIFFILQFASNEMAHHKKSTMINIVEMHIQQARFEGYFTNEIKNSLITEIEEKAKVPQDKIQTELTEIPVCSRSSFQPNNMISYRISIPMENVIAMAKFFDIPEDNNMYWFTLQGEVSSEKLCD